MPYRGTIEKSNSFIEQILLTDDRVVHETPKEELNEVPMENSREGRLIFNITESLKRKAPEKCSQILHSALAAYATNKEQEHQARTLDRGIPQSSPPTKRLCVMIDSKFYEEIKQEALFELRKQDTLRAFFDDDDDYDEDEIDSGDSATADDAQEEIQEFPMTLNFEFTTAGCSQRLSVQLIVPSVILDLISAQLKQMDVDQKQIFSFDDLVQLGRTKAEEVSVHFEYDKMLQSKSWITEMQNRCGVDWQEFPLIKENLRDPNFGNPTLDVASLQRPQAREVLLNGTGKVAIRVYRRNH